MPQKTKYWLMKSEPDVYSIENLKKDGTTRWEGVRNYMARNFMIRDMQIGDKVLFYHSNANPSGIAGIAEVSELASADPTQFDKKSEYYDPKSTSTEPRWLCVKVKYVSSFKRLVTLAEIKKEPLLKDMVLLHNSRLSVQPVTKLEFERSLGLSGGS